MKKGTIMASHAVRQFNKYKAANESISNPEKRIICLLLCMSSAIKGIASAMYMAVTLGFSQHPVTRK